MSQGVPISGYEAIRGSEEEKKRLFRGTYGGPQILPLFHYPMKPIHLELYKFQCLGSTGIRHIAIEEGEKIPIMRQSPMGEPIEIVGKVSAI